MNRFTFIFLFSFLLVTLLLSPVLAGEAGSYKLEGKGYFHYLHDASKGDGQSNNFDFKRMYFGTKYQLSEEFMIRYLIEIERDHV